MKPIRIAVVCALVSLCATMETGSSARGGEGAQPALPASFVVPLDLTPRWRQALPMRGNAIVRPERDGTPARKIKVRMQVTYYLYRVIQQRPGRAVELPLNEVKCYELVSDAPYTWASFVDRVWPLAGFGLFSLDDGTSYLCWASGHLIQSADVTRPRDRILAFQEYFNDKIPRGLPEAQLLDIVPGARQWGGPPQQQPDAVRILGLERDAEGALVLTVKDSKSPAAAVLALRDGEWALLHDYPDGLPEAAAGGPEPGNREEGN